MGGHPGARTRVLDYVYEDRYGYQIIVRRAGRTYSERHPHGTPITTLRRAVADLLERLTESGAVTEAGTLARDVARYCQLAAHLSDVGAQRAHLQAAVAILGHRPRATITRTHILQMRAAWLQAGAAPKTVNNRLSALRALWRLLDGPEAHTPLDRIQALRSHRTPPAPVSPALIVGVDQQLQAHEARGWLRDAKTRARFRVLATTGVRPSELMRAQPADVDLEAGVWRTRDGKGGFRPVGVPLTPAAVEAWRLFIVADAWGPYATDSFARVLRQAGWPAGVRPYELRHALGMALSEAGVDLADISLILGHTRVQTTRSHYVGPSYARMQAAMQRLDGRVAWLAPAASTEDSPVASTPQQKRPDTSGASRVPAGAKIDRKGQKS